MTRHLAKLGISGVRAVVVDIEGTTTPIAFVKDVLFPYAAAHLPEFVRDQHESPEVAAQLDAAREIAGDATLGVEGVIAALLAWIAEDRKATPLKTLQGMVWRHGYESGAYKAPLFDDVVDRLRHWHERGIALYVYSSGSIAAQKLLFAHTEHGDLNPLFSGYFDTTTGPKKERQSYDTIARELRARPSSLLFLSDSAAELDAAEQAGWTTVRLVRPGEVEPGSKHREVASFEAIDL